MKSVFVVDWKKEGKKENLEVKKSGAPKVGGSGARRETSSAIPATRVTSCI